MGVSGETQDKIIRSAIKLFAKKGYHGTKTAEIAKDCGVAEGTVFKYYGTKIALLRSVLNKIVHETLPGIVLQSSGEIERIFRDADPRSALKAFLKVRLMKAGENIDAFKIVFNELQYHEDIKKEYLGILVPGIIKMLEGLYDAGRLRGYFREVNPHIAARSFMGAVNMMMLEKSILNKELDIDSELDAVLDIYINGAGSKSTTK